ncbi:MAG TPA: carboxypeptidase-like regulatory domain-containing protein, partial [Kofleriaceae bacterium]|nr:carboxypeptidase-like regulatory domain-containing protein [Kofleriaceae bacterium]
MKKQLPLLIGSIAGALVVIDLFISRQPTWWEAWSGSPPRGWVGETSDMLFEWGQILAAAALVLGGINLMQVNYPKIRRREEDWQYKVVLLVSAAAMFAFGIPWHSIGGTPSAGGVTVEQGGGAGGKAALRVEAARPDAVVKVDGGAVPIAGQTLGRVTGADGGPLVIALEPGKHKVQVFMTAVGYRGLEEDFTVAAGQTAVARAALPLLWGKEGRFRTWVYDHVFFPCNATMFALLAFFIASAAFRAFRARNTEAALLLGAAIIVLLGRAPIGSLIN